MSVITPNVWHHYAFVRNGNNWLSFLDGVKDLDTSATGTVVTRSEAKNIGRWGNGNYWFNGQICEFRFSKGIARWDSTFAPPQSPYPESILMEKPVENWWWWRSSLSSLSSDHMNVVESKRSLRIDYPASSGIEDVSFVEGDYFGNDEDLGMRDGIFFWMKVDNVENLDTDYGYFYLGNEDTPVKYMWNISTINLNGGISNGWNGVFLRFKSYDDVEYSNSASPNEPDVRIPSSINFKTIGMRFRGKGNPIVINLDGFKLMKNRFLDSCYMDSGLYLVKNDCLSANIGGLTLSRGTIEFFIRPDFNTDGSGYFNDYFQRSLFVMKSLANDYFGAYVFDNDLNIYFGNINDDLRIFRVPIDDFWVADEVVHIGVVYSNNGTAISSDGSTIRVYVYGALQGTCYDTWEIGDDKKVGFFLGGKPPFSVAQKNYAQTYSIDSVVSELKIYNVCKTEFDSSISDIYSNYVKSKPSDLIQISKDNITFYSLGDANLPLFWENVPNNYSVPVYVRTNLPIKMTGNEVRTSELVVYWDIGV
jgi:hypothetical protein